MISGIFGAKVSIRESTVALLEKKFGRKDTEALLYEFNTAGKLEALTEKEGRFILRQSSLNSLRNRILTAARKANISPDAWEVRRSLLSQLSEGDTTTGLTPEATKQSLIKTFGAHMKRAIEKGKVVIHRTAINVSDGVKRSVEDLDDATGELTSAIKKWVDAEQPRQGDIKHNQIWKKLRDSLTRYYKSLATNDGLFWRGTNRLGEHGDTQKGIAIISTNHIDGSDEAGMSVSETPATIWAYGYKYGYKVSGRSAGKGSDGESHCWGMLRQKAI